MGFRNQKSHYRHFLISYHNSHLPHTNKPPLFPIAPVYFYLHWRIWSQNVANDMLCKHYILHYWYLVVIFVSCKYTIVQTTTHWCKLVRWQKKFTSLGSCNFKGVNNSNNFQDLDMNHCISAQYYLLFWCKLWAWVNKHQFTYAIPILISPGAHLFGFYGLFM